MTERYLEIADQLSAIIVKDNKSKSASLYQKFRKIVDDHKRNALEYRVITVDQGFDVSSRVEKTGKYVDFQTSDADFMDMATGQLLATYRSGNGMVAETYETLIQHDVEDIIQEAMTKHPLFHATVAAWKEVNEPDPDITPEDEIFEYLSVSTSAGDLIDAWTGYYQNQQDLAEEFYANFDGYYKT